MRELEASLSLGKCSSRRSALEWKLRMIQKRCRFLGEELAEEEKERERAEERLVAVLFHKIDAC